MRVFCSLGVFKWHIIAAAATTATLATCLSIIRCATMPYIAACYLIAFALAAQSHTSLEFSAQAQTQTLRRIPSHRLRPFIQSVRIVPMHLCSDLKKKKIENCRKM